jgi:AmmeMemoRadiSam system protein B
MSSDPLRPQLRLMEMIPVQHKGEQFFVFRDPDGFGKSLSMPHAAAVIASMMDGQRTLNQIQLDFRSQYGATVSLADLNHLTAQLDDAYLLESPRFKAFRQEQVGEYLANPVRPARLAGGAYEAEPVALRQQLNGLFTCAEGPGQPEFGKEPAAIEKRPRFLGALIPHIDYRRGGAVFGWGYKRLVEESDADLFVIIGTAHYFMRQPYSISRKHFDTPLGTVETDEQFIDRVQSHLAARTEGPAVELFADELAHRHEHSIELQVLLLQYLLGDRRPFKIVPVLVGSFHEFVKARTEPNGTSVVSAFVAAMQAAAAAHPGKVCYISSGDLAHTGKRFGDQWLFDQQKKVARGENDLQLLAEACKADSSAFFHHVAKEKDESRICGLPPTYTMMRIMNPTHGELLKYDMALEGDGSACVSFASLAFYGSGD